MIKMKDKVNKEELFRELTAIGMNRFKDTCEPEEDLKCFLDGSEQLFKLLRLPVVIRPFKTKFQLAEFMHNEYEKHAQNNGWNTQEKCKVEFKDLPEANKKTMLLVAESVLNAL